MDCPRCGVAVFADHTSCPACKWQLARPFSGGSSSGGNGSPGAAPGIQTAADAFVLTPPLRIQPGRSAGAARSKPARRRLHRSVSRGARQRSWQPLRNDGAEAALAEAARWEPPPRPDVVGMPVMQTSFDFTAAELEGERLAARVAAPLRRRCQAGLLDATCILVASGVFFGLFAALGGPLGLGRPDLLIYLLAGFTLAALYFGLFTLLGGCTPGMQRYGLRVATFEGQPLSPPRAVWRAFGYVVSTGALLLGFLWALVDDRHLTWHDHISQTFVTDRSDIPERTEL